MYKSKWNRLLKFLEGQSQKFWENKTETAQSTRNFIQQTQQNTQSAKTCDRYRCHSLQNEWVLYARNNVTTIHNYFQNWERQTERKGIHFKGGMHRLWKTVKEFGFQRKKTRNNRIKCDAGKDPSKSEWFSLGETTVKNVHVTLKQQNTCY
jgi:hypothetical protein